MDKKASKKRMSTTIPEPVPETEFPTEPTAEKPTEPTAVPMEKPKKKKKKVAGEGSAASQVPEAILEAVPEISPVVPEVFEAPEAPEAPAKKRRKTKKDRPDRPARDKYSGWTLYVCREREKLRLANPDAKGPELTTLLTKRCSPEWANMPKEEKSKFEEEAKILSIEDREMRREPA